MYVRYRLPFGTGRMGYIAWGSGRCSDESHSGHFPGEQCYVYLVLLWVESTGDLSMPKGDNYVHTEYMRVGVTVLAEL